LNNRGWAAWLSNKTTTKNTKFYQENNMKKITTFVLALGIFSLLSAKEITVSVEPGNHWKQKMTPQAAIWLEDESGNYIKTLYVTKKIAKKKFIFAPKEGRPEALPVWQNASNTEAANSFGSENKKNSAQLFDAVTSATPKGTVIFTTDIGQEKESFVIKAEFNTSFDYNDFYTKENSGVNGQPSVIYSAVIPKGFFTEAGKIILEFTGTGSLDGKDGKINPSKEKLTTALEIVKMISVKAN